ncbi:hypothetical protein FRC08_005171 [Ceratobasidium sp. 394]|nr:hypothetical protein FRC08_005171 [Ceratobasidium sp. 394]KAG9083283.1 hypothetical protein FS749_006154 [Ceratobasidium sp. UAMH 11750]
MARWAQVLTVRDPADWDRVFRYVNYVRELHCLDGAFSAAYGTVLQHFPRLYAVSIDAHSDVTCGATGRFAYCNLFTALPRSIRRLEITHAHGPDVRVIQLANRDCPLLEELRLGRCTMFNRHPACPFWESFSFDHDAYMSLDGADEYSRSLTKELSPMKHLAVLRLGVYLIPSTLVLSHRLFHTHDQPVPEHFSWQDATAALSVLHNETQANTPAGQLSRLISLLHQPAEAEFDEDTCRHCRDSTFQESLDAERSANAILQQGIPSLESIAWMNWFTPNHLGLSCGSRSK